MDSSVDTSGTSESELNSSSEIAGEDVPSSVASHTAPDTVAVPDTQDKPETLASKEGQSSSDEQMYRQQQQQYHEAMAAQMRYMQHGQAGNGMSVPPEQAMMMMPGMMPFMMPSYQQMMMHHQQQQQQQQQQGGSTGYMPHQQQQKQQREPDKPSAAGSPLNLQTSGGRGSADSTKQPETSSSSSGGGFSHSMDQQIRPAHQGSDSRPRPSPASSGTMDGGSQISVGPGPQPHAAHLHNPHHNPHMSGGVAGGSGEYGGGAAAPHTGSNVTTSANKAELPAPPKRPLTPYMRFSKLMWQQVKSANPGMSVCEIGATIGRLWRELSTEEKQRHNEDFTLDKARYDTELKVYLKTTGLHASDLIKKPKKKEPPKSAPQKRFLPPSSPSAAPSRPSPTPPNPSSSSNLMLENHQQQQQQAAAAAAAAHQQAMQQQQQLAQSFMGLPISSMAAGSLPMGMPMGMLTGFPQMWAAQQYGGLNMAAASGFQFAHQQAHHDLYAAGMAGMSSNGQHGESSHDPSHMAQMYLNQREGKQCKEVTKELEW